MTVRKRSVRIAGHRTSYSIEDAFQDGLAELARAEGISLAALIARIDAQKPFGANLSSALRLHAFEAAREGRLATLSPCPTGPDPRSGNEPPPR